MKKWLPPYKLALKQPKTVGDFVAGSSGPDFIISKKALQLFELNSIAGFEEVLPITVTKVGNKNAVDVPDLPVLFGVKVVRSSMRVLFDRMDVIWQTKPSSHYCKQCGPGGGGEVNGTWKSLTKIVVDENTYQKVDIFTFANLPIITISEKVKNLIQSNDLRNAIAIPIADFSQSF